MNSQATYQAIFVSHDNRMVLKTAELGCLIHDHKFKNPIWAARTATKVRLTLQSGGAISLGHWTKIEEDYAMYLAQKMVDETAAAINEKVDPGSCLLPTTVLPSQEFVMPGEELQAVEVKKESNLEKAMNLLTEKLGGK